MRGIARLFGFIFATGAIIFVVASAILAAVVWKYEQDLPDYSQLKNYEPPVMTRVHAADGSLLAEYSRERRLYLPSSSIPDLVKKAFISAEDKNFYTHHGFDPEGIVAPGIVFLQGSRRVQGASTITQQVAKNFLLNSDRTFDRKIREILLSLRIESAYSKEKILELYLNEIYLGLSNYGVARGRAELFRQVGSRADDRRSRLSGGAAEGAERAQSVPQPRSRGRAAQLRDRTHGRGRLHHRRAGAPGEGRAARRQSARADAEFDRGRLLRRGSAARAVGALRRTEALRGRPVGPHDARSEDPADGPEGAGRRPRAL